MRAGHRRSRRRGRPLSIIGERHGHRHSRRAAAQGVRAVRAGRRVHATRVRRYGARPLHRATFSGLIGARIAVESEVGKGTTFTLLAPHRAHAAGVDPDACPLGRARSEGRASARSGACSPTSRQRPSARAACVTYGAGGGAVPRPRHCCRLAADARPLTRPTDARYAASLHARRPGARRRLQLQSVAAVGAELRARTAGCAARTTRCPATR